MNELPLPLPFLVRESGTYGASSVPIETTGDWDEYVADVTEGIGLERVSVATMRALAVDADADGLPESGDWWRQLARESAAVGYVWMADGEPLAMAANVTGAVVEGMRLCRNMTVSFEEA